MTEANRNPTRSVVRNAWVLAAFAALSALLVSATYEGTRERIAANIRADMLRGLNQILPHDSYDNDPLEDSIEVTDEELLGSVQPQRILRARLDGEPVAAVLAVIAPNGYSGEIQLLAAIGVDGRLAGVRVTRHRETPGLGDAIEASRSDWIHAFAGRSIGDPPLEGWQIKLDGGVFDQFTGASITPRAVVQAVRNALLYFAAHREAIFAAPANPPELGTARGG